MAPGPDNQEDEAADHPLDKLSPRQLEALSDLPPEDIRALKRDRASRREWLKGGAAIASGLALGGGAAAGVDNVVNEAEASASTSDGDGDVGGPNNRVDLYADGVDSQSVATEEINNVQKPFNLLRQAGYSEGDFVSIGPSNTHRSAAARSTSSDTYSGAFGIIEVTYPPNLGIPDNLTPAARLSLDVDPNGDQVDVRIRDLTNDDTVVEKTGTTSDIDITAGPTEYSPALTDEPLSILLQFRNADNSTSVSARDALLEAGVIL